jgi:DNA-binding transcriptional regulator LsrR (DeoR family)
LHEALNGHVGRLLSMAAVPARLPSRLHFTDEKVTERERQVLTKFIRDTAGYRRIFLDGGESGGQKQRPLIQEMDSIITSVGSAYQNSGDPWIGEMTSREGITKEQLDRLAVGDIGGVFLPRPDLKGKHAQLEDLNARWTGPKLEHFQRCAKAASGGAAPGVIVLAIGRWKANVICECVRLGLVSELIIDHELARALVQ